MKQRMFTTRCPDCKRLLADSGKPHCDWKTNDQCDWMRCECGAHIDQSGTWTNGKRRGFAS